MKQLLHLLLTIIIFSCGDKNVTAKKQLPDTTITTIQTKLNWMINDYRTTTAIRLVKDSLRPDPSDKTKNIFFVDTSYYIPLQVPMRDSLNKVILDANNKPIPIVIWEYLPDSLVKSDWNEHWPKDSVFIKPIQKVDTLAKIK